MSAAGWQQNTVPYRQSNSLQPDNVSALIYLNRLSRLPYIFATGYLKIYPGGGAPNKARCNIKNLCANPAK